MFGFQQKILRSKIQESMPHTQEKKNMQKSTKGKMSLWVPRFGLNRIDFKSVFLNLFKELMIPCLKN